MVTALTTETSTWSWNSFGMAIVRCILTSWVQVLTDVIGIGTYWRYGYRYLLTLWIQVLTDVMGTGTYWRYGYRYLLTSWVQVLTGFIVVVESDDGRLLLGHLVGVGHVNGGTLSLRIKLSTKPKSGQSSRRLGQHCCTFRFPFYVEKFQQS